MLTPMYLEQHPKMPMGIVRAKSVKSPQNLFQIVGDIQNVVDRIAHDGLSGNVYSEDCAVKAKARKSLGNFRMCRPGFRRWPILALAWLANGRVVIAEGQFVQAPGQRSHRWNGAGSGEINEASGGGDVCWNHIAIHAANGMSASRSALVRSE